MSNLIPIERIENKILLLRGRDTFTNRKIWPDEINEMLEECLAALMAHENNKEELLY